MRDTVFGRTKCTSGTLRAVNGKTCQPRRRLRQNQMPVCAQTVYNPAMKKFAVSLLLFTFIALLLFAIPRPAASQTPTPTASPTAAPTTPNTSDSTLTEIQVRVISRGGKFVGDDIGGAFVTLRDALSSEVLASGRTKGGSGVADLMTIPHARVNPLPVEDAAVFTAQIPLDEPRLIEFSAYGPLTAQGSANRVTSTEWVVPGSFIDQPNVIQLEIAGLNVDILNPPTHFLPQETPKDIELRVNVTMMCGCPIGPETDWKPEDYVVKALIKKPDGTREIVPLEFDANAPEDAPSQFIAIYTASQRGIYEAIVFAHQPRAGNSGSDRVTFILP